MITIRTICKKDIPSLLGDEEFWKLSFMAISKHRLWAHYKNPVSGNEDIVLLLAYIDNELVGYMGAFIDEITIDNKEDKIAWLSTWWVHPKTKGSGIGREILNKMYSVQNGKIGISQFTPSAKRVYDKSGYFITLKENIGIKAVLKSDMAFLLPEIYPAVKPLRPLINLADRILNTAVSVNHYFCGKAIKNRLNDVKIEYLSALDTETEKIIEKYNAGHISKKGNPFFEWLKAYNWVQGAPLLELTGSGKYEFSMYDKNFTIYLIKVLKNQSCVGFLVLQQRNKVIKVLFAYYNADSTAVMADIIKLHCIRLNAREVICYDGIINADLKESGIFLYVRKKYKESIISKAFGKDNFDGTIMNYGDGDCSFA